MKPGQVCTLCGSSETRIVQTFEAAAIIQRWRDLFEMDVASEFSGMSKFELHECEHCSLQYFSPESLCGSGSLYAGLDRFDWYYVPQKWEHLQAISDIRGCRTVLEIGCGWGDFIELAKRSAKIEVWGLEKNPRAIEEARRRGITLDPSRLEDLAKASAGKYDAVCAFQVLEHVPAPGEFLRLCYELLTPGGFLVLGLPNAQSFLRFQSNILDLPPHHMSRWALTAIQFLPQLFPLRLRRLAFEPLAELHVPGYVDVYCDRLARWILPGANHPAIKSRLTRFLKATGIRKLLRGQTVYVVFEKVAHPAVP